MKGYNRGYQGNPEYQPYGMPKEEDEDFDMNDEWHEEEFDENVSHASSRAANTIVDSQRSTRLRNQLSKNSENPREVAPRASSPGIKRATNYDYRESSQEREVDDNFQGAYEEDDYLVVGHEVIEEEQYDNDPEARRDFRSAYDQLVERMHMEQGNDLLLNKEEYMKAMEKKQMRKQLKERTDDKIKTFNEGKRRKMELIKQENEKKEMEDCTFKPQLVAKPLQGRRKFNEFLEAQRKHEEDKALKRNILLEQESQAESGIIHHPEINESSRKMLAKKGNQGEPVHERLYGISKNNKQLKRIMNDAESENHPVNDTTSQRLGTGKGRVGDNENETFAPKINPRSKEIVRDQPVQELLYNDALRRKDMNELRKQKNDIKEMSKRKRDLNETNIEYLIHRFNKEFEPTFEAVAHQGEEEASDILNYRQLGELLFDMGFLSGSASSESEERILLSSMWTGLGGAQNEGLHKEVIRAFLLAVEGVKITDSVHAPSEEEFGQMKDGEFYPDCPKISKHFKLMYLNRIRHNRDGTKRKIMRVESEANQDCTFQPTLSENTQNLAQKYRQKIAENVEGGKITVLDILTAQTNKAQWIEETKKELESKAAEECTFHPMTNENVRIRQDESMQSTGDKCFDLYNLAVVKPKNKQDKTKEDYEFEKNGTECTFVPNINKDLTRGDDKPHYVNQRSIQDNLERMRKAREDREFKKKMTERGYGDAPAVKGASKKGLVKKPVHTRPTNYSKPAPKNDAKATSVATVGSRTKKSEPKAPVTNKAGTKRRGANERGGNLTKPTQSSMNRTNTKPTHTREVHTTEHQKYPEQDANESPEQVYRRIEEEEKGIHIKDNRDHEPQDDYEGQEPIERYTDPNESPEGYNNADYDNGDYNQQDEGDDESPEQDYPNDGNEEPDDEGEGNPLLFVDVNLGPGRAERIVVYEGDTAEQLAEEFTNKHGLDENLKEKLVKLLENQISSLLVKIDEENYSNSTDN